MTAADRADYNARVGRQVDDFRTFVNMHYMTERDDTPFWREVRAHRIHPETKERLAFWRKRDAAGTSISSISSTACRTSRRSSTIPVLDGLGILDPAVGEGGDGAAPSAPCLRAEDRGQPGQGIQAGGDQGAGPRRVPGPCARQCRLNQILRCGDRHRRSCLRAIERRKAREHGHRSGAAPARCPSGSSMPGANSIRMSAASPPKCPPGSCGTRTCSMAPEFLIIVISSSGGVRQACLSCCRISMRPSLPLKVR